MREGFLKKIGPLGMAIILIISAASIYMAFTVDLGVPQRYISQHDAEYYSQNAGTMEELLDELREFVFPALEGITESYVSQGGRVVIHAEQEHLERVRILIIRDFDEALFEFLPS